MIQFIDEFGPGRVIIGRRGRQHVAEAIKPLELPHIAGSLVPCPDPDIAAIDLKTAACLRQFPRN